MSMSAAGSKNRANGTVDWLLQINISNCTVGRYSWLQLIWKRARTRLFSNWTKAFIDFPARQIFTAAEDVLERVKNVVGTYMFYSVYFPEIIGKICFKYNKISWYYYALIKQQVPTIVIAYQMRVINANYHQETSYSLTSAVKYWFWRIQLLEAGRAARGAGCGGEGGSKRQTFCLHTPHVNIWWLNRAARCLKIHKLRRNSPRAYVRVIRAAELAPPPPSGL